MVCKYFITYYDSQNNKDSSKSVYRNLYKHIIHILIICHFQEDKNECFGWMVALRETVPNQ